MTRHVKHIFIALTLVFFANAITALPLNTYLTAGQLMRVGMFGRVISSEAVVTSNSASAVTTGDWDAGEVIRVICSTISYFDYGAAPVAETTETLVPVTFDYRFIVAENNTKVAFRAVTSAGVCTVSELGE